MFEKSKKIDLSGLVALVSWAAKGIGSCTAEVLSREGATVVICDILDYTEVASNIKKDGGEAYAFKCDVTAPSKIDSMVRQVYGSAWKVRYFDIKCRSYITQIISGAQSRSVGLSYRSKLKWYF